MSDFSGEPLLNLHGFYRGIVKDTTDPSQLGQIRVNVFGVFDSIDTQYLPWAKPATALFRGAGSGFGHFAVPEVDSYVWCFFEAGDMYQPVYFAAAPDGVHGLPSDRTTNYPNRVIWKTKAGIVIYIDDTDKEVKLDHPSGAYIKMDSAGNIEIKGITVHINP